MTEGFAAHLILMPDKQFKSAIALINDQGCLIEIRALDREIPFTRFYDGALVILPAGASPDLYSGSAPLPGEKVSVWRLYPYNLQERCQTELTRAFKLK
ncbi:MAG: hypothetical protein RR346_08485 [Bacteroidales bacterium]